MMERSDEIDFELEEADDYDFNSLSYRSVKLKNAIDIADLTDPNGAVIEIDDDELFQNDRLEISYDEESLKYAKYELLGDDPDDENDGTKVGPFQKMSRNMVDITKDKSGCILKKVIQEGDGPLVPARSKVNVHYSAYLEYAAEPFDSSLLRGSSNVPSFRLDSGELITGLDFAIQTMRKGEKSAFLVRHEYAYGSMGCPPRIPPKATVLFEVELFSFVDDVASIDSEETMTYEQLRRNFEKVMEVSQCDRRIGNEYFKRGQYLKAVHKYNHAIDLLEKAVLHNDEEQKKWQQLLVKLLVNMALVKDLLNQPRNSATFAKRALALDRNNVKALFRLGRCQNKLGEYRIANATLLRAKQMEPNNVEIQNEIAQLGVNVKRAKVEEKMLCSKMMVSMKSLKCDDDVKSKVVEELKESVDTQIADRADSSQGAESRRRGLR